MRQSPANTQRDIEKDPVFHDINRNKLSITLDITKPKAVGLVKKLVRKSDVLIENFSPRVLPSVGLEYESLCRENPNLIMISLAAAGQTGPLKDVQTYGPSLCALAGLDSLVGYPESRVLGSQGFYADMVSAAHGAFVVLAALYHRERSGKGQYIDLAQWMTTVGCIAEPIMDYIMNQRVGKPQGNINRMMAPHNCYRCRDKDGLDTWVAIAIKNDDDWHNFCEAIGNPDWANEERFNSIYDRWKNQHELDKLITAWTINRTAIEVTDILQQSGIAAAPTFNIGERFFDPHFQAREAFLDCDHPMTGTDIISGFPWKLNETPARLYSHAPLLGEHNEYVFKEMLGLSKTEFCQLVEEEVIY